MPLTTSEISEGPVLEGIVGPRKMAPKSTPTEAQVEIRGQALVGTDSPRAIRNLPEEKLHPKPFVHGQQPYRFGISQECLACASHE